MKIKIDKKYRPFASSPGTFFPVLGSNFVVQIFPTKLEFFDKKDETGKSYEIFFNITKAVDKFIVFLDLERKKIDVSFFLDKKLCSYNIFVEGKKIYISLKKSFDIPFEIDGKKNILKVKNKLELPFRLEKVPSFSNEKLFLGVNKAQDIEKIKKREDLKEIFPILYSLSQMVPLYGNRYEGVARLLINLKTKKDFLNIFKAGFSGLSPKLFDDNYLGVVDRNLKISKDASSLIILNKLYKKIREIFIKEEDNKLFILPSLFDIFFCGSLINVKTKFGKLDINFSKKIIKKMIFTPFDDCEVKFCFKKIKSFRVKEKNKKAFKIYLKGEKIVFEKNKTYFFDLFCK